MVNELRSSIIQAKFIEVFEATHTIKQISANKMDDTYQHELIQMFFMRRKKGGGKKEKEEEGREPEEI